MRVLICGSRYWASTDPIEMVVRGLLSLHGPETIIIHGAATGADTIAAEAAERHGLAVEGYPADWATYGKAAGPIRNQLMLDDGKPQLVIAFTDSLVDSKGTADMVQRARAALIPVYVLGRQ